MLVSIIIPVYNAQSWLVQSIESALSQSYEQKEVIVVDDGSTDNSYELARQFEKNGIKVIRQNNAGAAVARNTGLSHAKGEYIQFLDAGDLLSTDKIQKQVEALRDEPNKLAVCNYLQFRSEEEINSPLMLHQAHFIHSNDQPLDFLVNLWGGDISPNFIQTNCWLVPRSLIEKAGNWRTYRCPDDDGEFFTRIILASKGIVYVPGIYNYYRMAPGANQLSSNRKRKYLMNSLLTLDLKHRYLLGAGDHPSIKKAMATLYLEYAVYNFPSQVVLAKLALRKYRLLGVKARTPLLGGQIFEWIRLIFGWRTARLIRYYLREKRKI